MGADRYQEQLLFEFLEMWSSGEEIMTHTSGSTGPPKLIRLPKTLLERSARRTLRFFGITRKSHLHLAISFEYIGGKMMIVRSLIAGCRLTYSTPSLTPELPVDACPIDLMAVVPAQMPYILDHPREFSNVKNFLLGGSAIDSRLWERIVDSGINAWESYGMTETASHIALRRIVGNGACRPKFITLPGITISLNPFDCLVIKDGDWIVETNDIARIYADRSFEIISRQDDIIISGGIKIIPQEVENVLRDHLSRYVSDFYVSSLPDEIFTARLLLIAVPLPHYKSGTARLIEILRELIASIPLEVLPRKKRPKEIMLVPSLPLTPSGKLNRKFNIGKLM